MRHTIVDRENLGDKYWCILVELNPDNDKEVIVIRNNKFSEFNTSENELIENYLTVNLIELGNYSIINFQEQHEALFELKILRD